MQLIRWLLSFGDQIEQFEELREADGGGFRALNQRLPFGAKSGDAEGHGNAMVASRVNGCPVQSLATGNVQAVFKLGNLGAHGAQILHDQLNAVGLFHAKLFGVADANASTGIGRDGGKNRKLVDELRGKCAS